MIINFFFKLKSSAFAYKDAVFFSGHKLLGGPQTPVFLYTKRFAYKNKSMILNLKGRSCCQK